IDRGEVDLGARVEGAVHRLARAHVLELGAHEGTALAGLDVLELHHAPELSVDAEDGAVLDVVGRGHASVLFRSGGFDGGCAGTSVSGAAGSPRSQPARGVLRRTASRAST